MYVNLSKLISALYSTSLHDAFSCETPKEILTDDEQFNALVIALGLADIALNSMPAIWVEIQGDETYVKHSLLDIS